jgi:hypothetical protein
MIVSLLKSVFVYFFFFFYMKMKANKASQNKERRKDQLWVDRRMIAVRCMQHVSHS